MAHITFRRIVITGVESSGKSTLARALARHLTWPYIPEAARTHPDVLHNTVTRETLDDLHHRQMAAVRDAVLAGHVGCICVTGELVLQIWAAQIGIHWVPHPYERLVAERYLLCPALPDWEPDPLRNLPEYRDRVALEQLYRARLQQRPHLVVRGNSRENRLLNTLADLR